MNGVERYVSADELTLVRFEPQVEGVDDSIIDSILDSPNFLRGVSRMSRESLLGSEAVYVAWANQTDDSDPVFAGAIQQVNTGFESRIGQNDYKLHHLSGIVVASALKENGQGIARKLISTAVNEEEHASRNDEKRHTVLFAVARSGEKRNFTESGMIPIRDLSSYRTIMAHKPSWRDYLSWLTLGRSDAGLRIRQLIEQKEI